MRPRKASGVAWLGDIPSDWSLNYLGNVVQVAGGSTPSKENLDFWGGTIPWVSPKDMKRDVISDSEDHLTELALKRSSLRLIPSPAVLMVIRGMILDHTVPIGLTARPVTLNQDMKALRPRTGVSAEYLTHFLRAMNEALLARVEEAGHGTKALRTELWRKLPVLLPPEQEQRAIVSYLDGKTAAIDALIAKKERLIELLREKRQALITQGVTKGLDPNVPMKESRNPFLGTIPRHWEPWSVRDLLRMRHLEVQDGNHGELHPVAADYVDDGIPFLMANNVRGGSVDLVGCKFIPQDLADGLRIGFAREGDVLLTHKGTLGETAILSSLATPYAMLTPQVTYYRSRTLFDRRYLYFFLTSEVLQEQLRFISSVQSTRGYVGITAQRDLVLLVPPVNEQMAISDFLEPRVRQKDNLLARIAQSILGLREYRQALITAAVTGKIDVSKEAA